MTSDEPAAAREPSTAERIEADRDRAGRSGDGLAQAVDRHRDELGMPPEPADGEDAATDGSGATRPEPRPPAKPGDSG